MKRIIIILFMMISVGLSGALNAADKGRDPKGANASSSSEQISVPFWFGQLLLNAHIYAGATSARDVFQTACSAKIGSGAPDFETAFCLLSKESYSFTPQTFAVLKEAGINREFCETIEEHRIYQQILQADKTNKEAFDKAQFISLDKVLREAAQNGHAGRVRDLISKFDADVNTVDRQTGDTPLTLAAERGHEGVISVLMIRGGYDANAIKRAYERAKMNNHFAVMKQLAERGGGNFDYKADFKEYMQNFILAGVRECLHQLEDEELEAHMKGFKENLKSFLSHSSGQQAFATYDVKKIFEWVILSTRKHFNDLKKKAGWHATAPFIYKTEAPPLHHKATSAQSSDKGDTKNNGASPNKSKQQLLHAAMMQEMESGAAAVRALKGPLDYEQRKRELLQKCKKKLAEYDDAELEQHMVQIGGQLALHEKDIKAAFQQATTDIDRLKALAMMDEKSGFTAILQELGQRQKGQATSVQSAGDKGDTKNNGASLQQKPWDFTARENLFRDSLSVDVDLQLTEAMIERCMQKWSRWLSSDENFIKHLKTPEQQLELGAEFDDLQRCIKAIQKGAANLQAALAIAKDKKHKKIARYLSEQNALNKERELKLQEEREQQAKAEANRQRNARRRAKQQEQRAQQQHDELYAAGAREFRDISIEHSVPRKFTVEYVKEQNEKAAERERKELEALAARKQLERELQEKEKQQKKEAAEQLERERKQRLQQQEEAKRRAQEADERLERERREQVQQAMESLVNQVAEKDTQRLAQEQQEIYAVMEKIKTDVETAANSPLARGKREQEALQRFGNKINPANLELQFSAYNSLLDLVKDSIELAGLLEGRDCTQQEKDSIAQHATAAWQAVAQEREQQANAAMADQLKQMLGVVQPSAKQVVLSPEEAMRLRKQQIIQDFGSKIDPENFALRVDQYSSLADYIEDLIAFNTQFYDFTYNEQQRSYITKQAAAAWIMAAVQRNDAVEIQKCLDYDSDLVNYAALHAARYNNHGAVDVLLQAKANPLMQDPEYAGWTPLKYAEACLDGTGLAAPLTVLAKHGVISPAIYTQYMIRFLDRVHNTAKLSKQQQGAPSALTDKGDSKHCDRKSDRN